MHHVDRGPEPAGLSAVRQRYTPRWVSYYRNERRSKPSDSKWRDFHEDVSDVFVSLCGYCEEWCEGEVDHFRPKSKYPDRVYAWDNWVLACHTCNHKKSGRWPKGGYVDPCAKSKPGRPESFFEFDIKTGEILPNSGITAARRRRADRMINDLKLNAYYHLKKRANWLFLASEALAARRNTNETKVIQLLASRGTEYSSITRAWLQEHGYTFDDGCAMP